MVIRFLSFLFLIPPIPVRMLGMRNLVRLRRARRRVRKAIKAFNRRLFRAGLRMGIAWMRRPVGRRLFQAGVWVCERNLEHPILGIFYPRWMGDIQRFVRDYRVQRDRMEGRS
jgi:hypothetical protein